tara:strand:- start:500 stop:1342 length:843 start_codon:yes stop_codon:yes gene_type:complete
MATTTFDPTPDAPSPEQQAAETAALEQGEKIAEAEQQDRDRLYDERDKENENIELIDGKFKSQEDLLKAYKELESKLGKNEPEEQNETTEEQPEAKEETPEETPNETVEYMTRLTKEFDEKGELSEEALDNLSKMDSKELIKSYLEYYGKTQSNQKQATIQANEINQIKESVGGEKTYNEMIGWAAENLNATEINDYNAVTNSGNPAAIRFAVEALKNRYTAAEGYEAPLVTGGKAASTAAKPYRSQAELARDIQNPLYSTDPAFRQDVEARLSQSTDML